jgi:F0F1-type ATP synthase membrane subunit c/vacuolar-type H+-ATPase subunit K
MNGLSPEVLVTIVSIITSGIVIMVGVIVPETWEGKIATKAVEGIARQPEAAEN